MLSPLGNYPIKADRGVPDKPRPVECRPSPRQAYEDGMPIHVIRRRYHLSDSEAQDVAPEEFEVEQGQNKVSGY